MAADEKIVPRFVGMASLTATLEVRTGLHIGAGKDTVEIGGIDNPVIKTPSGDPYVPGSSIKGRMRFLLEWAFNKVRADGHAWGWDEKDYGAPGILNDPILRIFGTNAKREVWNGGPTRLLMRDAMPCGDWREGELEAGRELTEAKTEVVIDRIAGKALDNVGPRQTERVPPGARFAFEAGFRVYSINNDDGRVDLDCLAWTIEGLRLIEQDALGGSGSRGYGRVAFSGLKLVGPKGEALLDNHRPGAFDPARPDASLRKAVGGVFGID